MNAVQLISLIPNASATAPVPRLTGLIEQLRLTGRRLRLHQECDTSPLGILLSRLPAMLDRRLVFHEIGAIDVSFDEAWLLNMLDAVLEADEDRYRFALLSRMRRDRASAVHFLICQAAHALEIPSR